MDGNPKDDGGDAKKSLWNSLEITKLVVSISTPLLLVFVGYVVGRSRMTWFKVAKEQRRRDSSRMQEQQTELQRVRQLRLQLYKETGPLLNDIFAYHLYVGRWKEFTPTVIMEKKRTLDTLMYSHEFLFVADFFSKYVGFMSASFRTAGGWHTDSRLRTMSKCRPNNSADEQTKWEARFTQEDNRRNICIAYRDLLSSLASELLFMTAQDRTDEQKIAACPPFYDTATCR